VGVSEALSAGLSTACRRAEAIIADVFWKIVWMILAALMFLGVILWINGEIGSIEISGPSVENPIALLVLARQIWAQYASTIFWLLAVWIAVSAAAWMILEAYFRAGLLPDSAESFPRCAAENFKRYLASGVLKCLVVGSSVVLVGLIVFSGFLNIPVDAWGSAWTDSRLAVFTGAIICLAVWFALTVLETAIRADALESLGRELFLVTGIVGTLVTFEVCVSAGVVLGLATVMFFVSTPFGVLLALGSAGIAVLFLTVLHAYLLVARYSAVSILSGPVQAHPQQL
jgi:hypothetical protein